MGKKNTEDSSRKRSSTKRSTTKSNSINSPSTSGSSKNRKFKKRRESLHKINEVEENIAVDVEKEEQKKKKKMKKKENCHQCHIRKENVVHCNKCHIKKYCIPCITKWYPNFSKEEFTEACPACCNICNCRACLRAFSPKDLQGYFCSEPDKLRYSKHMLQKIFHLVTYLDEEQLMEKEIDAKVKGLHRSELQLQEAECDVDDEISCDNCGTYIFDLYRCCTCGYELCLACSRELRGGHLQGGKGLTCGWKAHKDGSIPCPPKDAGGCDDGILELKRIMPAGWLSNMLEKAQKLYKINGSHAIPQTSIECCACYDNRNETTFEKCNARHMIFLNAKDIQPQDSQHFQLHWAKGEPIIVSDVLQTTSGLSWEPMVMWRAFRDITKTRNDSHANELKAINFLDWSEVPIDLYQFFRGYSEGLIIQKGCPLILKLEDWQPAWLSQGEWMRHFVEIVRYLPLKDYTDPNSGYLNVATKLPDLSLKPELGPRMDIAYADSVTKLHYNKSDTVNVLTHTESGPTSPNLNKPRLGKRKHGDQDEASLQTNDDQQHVADPMEGGALWDIFQKQDISKLEEYLRNHSAEFSLDGCHSAGQVVHPIHDQTFYLNMEHKGKLKEKFGIEPWTFKQKLGDAVFIPAGCPYQVKNLKSCMKVELNFLSPESLGECIRLQNEIRMLPNSHRGKSQKLNIGKMMIYALDHAVAYLSGVVNSTGPVDDLQTQFVEVPEILNVSNDMNIGSHTNGWVCDTESDNDSQETNRVALSPLGPSTSVRRSSAVEVDHTVNHQHDVIEDSGIYRETTGSWRGNDVGLEVKELLQAVEHHYPNTFQGVQIRPKPYWQSILKGLHVAIKGFLEASVDALAEVQICSLHDDLNDFEALGFDLSWARNRLDMVKKLKFGNDSLRLELVASKESLETLKGRLDKAQEALKKAWVDYDSAKDTRKKTLQEVAVKLGAEYDDVFKGNLGFGMLPGY
uniref:lysine-specific demethylase JMJ25-like n=1 Tax=Erigeron canadensis TaxID=72917 RepID=UPI001CB967D9|nr:lysine-specific demethylase JMJ25-like [Erigeron canadensis]